MSARTACLQMRGSPYTDIEYGVYSLERQNQEHDLANSNAEVSLALDTSRQLYLAGS